MSSTSVTNGPIYARSAVHRSIQLKLLAWFPIDRSRISVGAQSQISTEGHGAPTMATLRSCRTRSCGTFQRSDRAGDIGGGVRKSEVVARRRVRKGSALRQARHRGPRYGNYGPAPMSD